MPAKSSASAPTHPRRRRWPLLLFGVLVLLAGGHAALWAWTLARIEEGAATWAMLRRAEGWQVEHGAAIRGGWPLSASVTLADVALRRDGIGWRAERLTLAIAARDPGTLRLAADGRMLVEAGAQTVPMTATGLAADLPLAADSLGIAGLPRRALLRAERVGLDLPAGPLALAAPRIELETGDGLGPADPLAVLRGTAAMVTLPPGMQVLGPNLDRLGLDLVLGGPWPGFAGTPAARAGRWRDGGGTLEVRSLGFGWGAARVDTTATLQLDAALQPKGEGLLRLAGAGAVLQAAQQAGLVGRREAAGAQLVLAMMQKTPPEGGPPRLELPLLLEGRSLSVAGMTLARLPPWRWN